MIKLFFVVLLIYTNSVFSQQKLNLDSSSFFGNWRISEIRGENWIWDVNKWRFKQKSDTVIFSNGRIGDFELPNTSDIQNVGFDLLKQRRVIIYYGYGLRPSVWWYKKEKNTIFTRQKCGTYCKQEGWTAFIENSRLKLKSGINPTFIMERN